MYTSDDLKELSDAFEAGLKILKGIEDCFPQFMKRFEVSVKIDPVDEKHGELVFWFAGKKMYAVVYVARFTNKAEARETVNQIRWGNFNEMDEKEEAIVVTPYGEETKVSVTETINGKSRELILDTEARNDTMFFEPVIGRLLSKKTFLGTEITPELSKRLRGF